MKRGLIIVLVLSLLVGMMSLSSFAAVGNFQNGGMMYGNNSNYSGGMMNGNFAGRGGMMNGNFSGRGGMMNGNFAGTGNMMNGNYGSMMGNGNGITDGIDAGVLSENAISLDTAYDIGKSYLEKELSSEYTLDKEGIAAGDYYTFFIEAADKTVGRLSVNALTSEVWLHNCRGLLQ